MKRSVLKGIAAGLVIISLLAVSACSKKETSGVGADGGLFGAKSIYDIDNMKFENVSIHISSRNSSDIPMHQYFRTKIQEFSDKANGITVTQDNIQTESDYQNRLRANFASGSAPNIFMEYGGSRILDYVESSTILNMKPYYDYNPAWYNSFNSAVWEKLLFEQYPGVWGIPFYMYTVVIYYNKEIFAKHGLSVPTNWQELQDVCAKFKAAGVKPFQVGEKDIWRLGHFHNNLVVKSLGVQAVGDLATRKLTYDSPEIIKTFDMIKEMIDKGYFGDNILATDVLTERATYAAEGCAMRWDGSWYVAEIFGKDIYNKTGVAPFPYVDEKYKLHAQGGANDMWFITTLGKSPEEIAASVALTKYLTSEEYIANLNEIAASIYPVKFTLTPKTPSNPIMEQVQALADSMTDMRGDVQDYDPQAHMIDTVRSSIQALAMGYTGKQVGDQIVNRIKEYGGQ
jgi:ABC-type glycerol-3-phosphate transport system substrate-binding protein